MFGTYGKFLISLKPDLTPKLVWTQTWVKEKSNIKKLVIILFVSYIYMHLHTKLAFNRIFTVVENEYAKGKKLRNNFNDDGRKQFWKSCWKRAKIQPINK